MTGALPPARFLANENMLGSAVRELRALGHDILWAKESFPGARDTEVLATAMMENRVLLTQDKDFGELAFAHGLPATCGIVFFRLPADSPGYVVHRMVEAIQSRSDWVGHFTTVTEDRIRMRPLPPV